MAFSAGNFWHDLDHGDYLSTPQVVAFLNAMLEYRADIPPEKFGERFDPIRRKLHIKASVVCK
jgi:hypothetical protein